MRKNEPRRKISSYPRYLRHCEYGWNWNWACFNYRSSRLALALPLLAGYSIGTNKISIKLFKPHVSISHSRNWLWYFSVRVPLLNYDDEAKNCWSTRLYALSHDNPICLFRFRLRRHRSEQDLDWRQCNRYGFIKRPSFANRYIRHCLELSGSSEQSIELGRPMHWLSSGSCVISVTVFGSRA